jgi:hypothetical protein
LSDAGLSSDGNTVWMHFTTGATAGISLSEDSLLMLQKPSAWTGSETTAPSTAPSIQGITMAPYILAPFYDDLGIYDLAIDQVEYYLNPVTGLPILEPYVQDRVTVDLLKNILGFDGYEPNTGTAAPQQFIMCSHGDLVRLRRMPGESAVIHTGQTVRTKSDVRPYYRDIYHDRVVIVQMLKKKIKNLCVTPLFVRNYAKPPRSDDRHFLNRYVFLIACNSGHSSLQEAFLETGAVCYAGWDGPVCQFYAWSVSSNFFFYLTRCETVQTAYDKTNPKKDPTTGSYFGVSGWTLTARFFYRAFLEWNGAKLATPAWEWLDMLQTEGSNGPLYQLTGVCVDEKTGQLTGFLSILLDSPSAGVHEIEIGSETGISFTDYGGMAGYEAYGELIKEQVPCSGRITITEFPDAYGWPVEGSFETVLATPVVKEFEIVWETAAIKGNFIGIRGF